MEVPSLPQDHLCTDILPLEVWAIIIAYATNGYESYHGVLQLRATCRPFRDIISHELPIDQEPQNLVRQIRLAKECIVMVHFIDPANTAETERALPRWRDDRVHCRTVRLRLPCHFSCSCGVRPLLAGQDPKDVPYFHRTILPPSSSPPRYGSTASIYNAIDRVGIRIGSMDEEMTCQVCLEWYTGAAHGKNAVRPDKLMPRRLSWLGWRSFLRRSAFVEEALKEKTTDAHLVFIGRVDIRYKTLPNIGSVVVMTIDNRNDTEAEFFVDNPAIGAPGEPGVDHEAVSIPSASWESSIVEQTPTRLIDSSGVALRFPSPRLDSRTFPYILDQLQAEMHDAGRRSVLLIRAVTELRYALARVFNKDVIGNDSVVPVYTRRATTQHAFKKRRIADD